MFSLLEDNQRFLLYSGGDDMKDNVVAIVMIEIVWNKLFAHQLLKKPMVETSTTETATHTNQHSLYKFHLLEIICNVILLFY
jgi:hypothetical protein